MGEATEKPVGGAIDASGMSVLVCDDDPTVRLVVRRLLERYFRCKVSECGNGSEALDLLGRETFALLFLDLTMPVMDGIATLARIRQLGATANLPVIILSSESDADAIKNVISLGISDYVLKPPRTQAVISKVENLLRTLPKA